MSSAHIKIIEVEPPLGKLSAANQVDHRLHVRVWRVDDDQLLEPSLNFLVGIQHRHGGGVDSRWQTHGVRMVG